MFSASILKLQKSCPQCPRSDVRKRRCLLPLMALRYFYHSKPVDRCESPKVESGPCDSLKMESSPTGDSPKIESSPTDSTPCSSWGQLWLLALITFVCATAASMCEGVRKLFSWFCKWLNSTDFVVMSFITNFIDHGDTVLDFPPEANVSDIRSSSVDSILDQTETHYILKMTNDSVMSMAKPVFEASFVRAQNGFWSQKTTNIMNQLFFL